MERRERKNDANDMYEKYYDLESPEITARKIIYETFFWWIDPQGKFRDINKKIFDIICKEFGNAQIIHKKNQESQSINIQQEKVQEQGKQEKKVEQLINKLNEPIVKSKVLIDNILAIIIKISIKIV